MISPEYVPLAIVIGLVIALVISMRLKTREDKQRNEHMRKLSQETPEQFAARYKREHQQ